jgi:hypothetical protein
MFCEGTGFCAMAKGTLRLPANFKVKYFGSRRNVNGIGKYVAISEIWWCGGGGHF